jgi:hypothetical protein
MYRQKSKNLSGAKHTAERHQIMIGVLETDVA